MTRLIKKPLSGAVLFTALIACHTQASTLDNSVWSEVGSKFDLDPVLLYSVALVESGVSRTTDYGVSAWPYTLRVKDFNYYADTKEEAEAVLIDFQSKYGNMIDIGFGQINVRWHGQRVDNPSELLDPVINIRVMAEILSETHRSTNDLELQIGRYHSYRETDARRYAKKVMTIYNNLKNSDF